MSCSGHGELGSIAVPSPLTLLPRPRKSRATNVDQHLHSFELFCIWHESYKARFPKIFKERSIK